MKKPRTARRSSWQDAFRERFRAFCQSRGIPIQETVEGQRAARSHARRLNERKNKAAGEQKRI